MEQEKIIINSQNDSKIRAIIFVIATIMLFLLWGGRIYADSVTEIVQGTCGEVSGEVCASPYENITAYQIVELPSGEVVPDVILEFPEHHELAFTMYSVKFQIPSTMMPGSYQIKYCNDGFWYDMVNGQFMIVASETSDWETQNTDTEKGKKESPYIPLSPEEQYQQTLAQWYPSGFSFLTVGSTESFSYLSNDSKTCSTWKNGIHIADFSFVTDDGSTRKMMLQNPITVDGISYLSVWVNVNDGAKVSLQISKEERQALLDLGVTGIYLNQKLILL